MKVITRDNFDREGPHAVEERVVAGPGLGWAEAVRIAGDKNAEGGPGSFIYYDVVEDDYILAPPWEP